MTLNPLTALRLRLLRNGYTPLPVVGPNYPGKSPGKRPGIPEWQSVDIDEASIKQSKYVYIEGYLFAGDSTKAAALKAIELAKKAGEDYTLTEKLLKSLKK